MLQFNNCVYRPQKIMQSSGKTLWSDIWRRHWYSDGRRRERRAAQKFSTVKSILIDIEWEPNIRVAEIGCGSGHFLKQVIQSDLLSGEFFACDWSQTAIQLAAKTLFATRNIRFIVCNAEQLPFKNDTLELILLVCVIEHLANKRAALNEVRRVISRDGHILLFYSNSRSSFAWQRKIKSIFFKWPFGYQDELTIEQIRSLLNENFKIATCGVVHGDWDFPILKITDWIIHIFNRRWGRYTFVYAKALR